VSTRLCLNGAGRAPNIRGEGKACGKAECGMAGTEQGGEVERNYPELSGTNPCVKKKSISGMALHGQACFFWIERKPVAEGAAAILHNAVIGQWPHQAGCACCTITRIMLI